MTIKTLSKKEFWSRKICAN